MSLKDLHDHGILLPEEEWGVHDLHTSVNKPELIASMLFGLISVAIMYFGGGETLTFVGMVMFILFMGWITRLSVKAIEVQAAQFAEEREAIHMEDEPLPGESGGGE
jgi:steroid 5-alpha reductase family enzyme